MRGSLRTSDMDAHGHVSWCLPPERTSCLFGCKEVVQDLQSAWRSGRFPHAWLLSGPRGCGKATLAFRFARAVFTGRVLEDWQLAETDPVFVRVAEHTHADLRVLRASGKEDDRRAATISIAQVRDLLAFLKQTICGTNWRVVIVDSAEHLTTSATNALLKVVEEPRRRCLFLLLAHCSGRILPTLASRCCRERIRPMDDVSMSSFLGHHEARRRFGLSDEEVAELVRLSDGRPGVALEILALGGLAYTRQVAALLERLPQSGSIGSTMIVRFVDRILSEGPDFRLLRLVFDAVLAHVRAHVHRQAGLSAEEQRFPVFRDLPLASGLCLWDNLRRLRFLLEYNAGAERQILLAAFSMLQACVGASTLQEAFG